jgi:hypothetical protein
MELEKQFGFLGADDIRISGTRIGIETVLGSAIHVMLVRRVSGE